MNKVILVGAFHETVELCIEAGLEIVGIVDNKSTENFYGYPILGSDNDVADLFHKYSYVPVVIVPDPPIIRQRLYSLYKEAGFSFKTVVSPSAKISKTAHIGEGCLIQHGTNVSSSATLGNFVKLNTFANIMHDCKIGDFTTVAPNAVLLGGVVTAETAFIGANATILPGKKIGVGALVGAGSVVTKDVKDKIVVAGNPARELKTI